jgi:hypothetical protein
MDVKNARDAVPAVNTVAPAIEAFEVVEAKPELISSLENFMVDSSF